MPSSLSPLRNRVDRLAQRLFSNACALDDIFRRMSDDELQWHRLEIVELSVGPIRAFLSPDHVVQAMKAAPGGADWGDSLLDLARRHWRRLHWFDNHAAHGVPELIRRDHSRTASLTSGPLVIFRCPGTPRDPGRFDGSLCIVATYEELVPAALRHLTPLES